MNYVMQVLTELNLAGNRLKYLPSEMTQVTSPTPFVLSISLSVSLFPSFSLLLSPFLCFSPLLSLSRSLDLFLSLKKWRSNSRPR